MSQKTLHPKTNAARLLDRLKVVYEIRSYEVDPLNLSAASVAEEIRLPLEQVFKTLLTRSSGGGYLFAVVPGDAELDLKKLASAAGARKVELAPLRDLESLTGYIRGGVTAFAAKKAFPVFADKSLEHFDLISVSAGQRGLQILLAPADYLRVLEATLTDLTKRVPST